MNYIRILRPINLLIVAVSQFLIFWIYLMPLRSDGDLFVLKDNLWWLFILDTVLIAAGGYVINDLMDQKTDQINKPEKVFISAEKISMRSGLIYYRLIVFIGLAIAFYIAIEIDKILLVFIYPIATILLYAYSANFKKLPLVGNLVVSLFCAFVPAIIWFAEFDFSTTCTDCSAEGYDLVVHLFTAYIIFAFLSTMVREIIKDIEDVEGDSNSNYQTLPIVVGIDRAKVIALFFGLILLGSYGFWLFGYTVNAQNIVRAIIIIGMVLPTIYILNLIRIARTTSDYARISKSLKYLMIISLFIFLCIPIIIRL